MIIVMKEYAYRLEDGVQSYHCRVSLFSHRKSVSMWDLLLLKTSSKPEFFLVFHPKLFVHDVTFRSVWILVTIGMQKHGDTV